MADVQHIEPLSPAQRGPVMICGRCGNDCERTNPAQKYCAPCRKIVRAERHRARNARYEAKRPPRKRLKPRDMERRREWIERNPEKRAASVRAYNERNREKINEKFRERRAKPEVKAKRRAIAQVYDSHPKRRLDDRMGSAIYQSLKGKKAGRRWEALVGYSCDELYRHIERQFVKGMSWANMGEWHIDHIVPKSSFRYEDAETPEFRAAWAITNLRPLWSEANRSKHARRTHLI